MKQVPYSSLLEPLPPRWNPGLRVLEQVKSALGRTLSEPVLDSDESLQRYARDESWCGDFFPHYVVTPRSTEEVSHIMRVAHQYGVPVTPRGAGTGKSGGCLAVRGGIVVSFEKMSRLLTLDAPSHTADVEPGLITGDFQRMVESHHLFYPPDPASLDSCTLGGNVATNAGGPRAFKYGVTQHYVLGATWVCADGQVIRGGKRTLKGVVGYDLTSLLVGSEGTLALLTSLTLRLVPLPPQVSTTLFLFKDVRVACAALMTLLQAGHQPRTLELLDQTALQSIRHEAPHLIDETCGAALIIETDGVDEAPFTQLTHIAEAIAAMTAAVWVASDEEKRRHIWALRRKVSYALKAMGRFKVSEDIAVPRAHLADLVEEVAAIAGRYALRHAAYGHAGDGNLHANFIWDDPAQEPDVARALDDLMRFTLQVGGTVSGEHGIGLLKRRYAQWECDPALIHLCRHIKSVWDPAALLNPGKIWI